MLRDYFWILFFLIFSISVQADTKPINLHTDLLEHTDRIYSGGYISTQCLWHVKDPSNSIQIAEIHSSRPVFGWSIQSDMQDTKQTAYRIMVFDNVEVVDKVRFVVWDSGKIESRETSFVKYGGKPLLPDKIYFWKVKVFTNTDGESEWSEIKVFKTAKKLNTYEAAGYPIQKTDEYPFVVNKVQTDTYFIDFGKAAFAQLYLLLSSDSEDSIRIHLGESLDLKGRVNRKPRGTIRYQCYDLHLQRGTHTYQVQLKKDKRNTGPNAIKMPDYIGEVMPFRYCEIEGYKESLGSKSVRRASVHYQFDDCASNFKCSNDILNQIWDMCKYSIKATSFTGIYVDGDRERIPYEADALINQLCHYSVDHEYSMARRSHEYLLEHPTWPTEWILQAILIAWYDYMYTGNSNSLQKYYDVLRNRTLLALKEKNGLISTTTGLQTSEFIQSIKFRRKIRDIVDWPHSGILGLEKAEVGESDGYVFTDYNTVVNAFHYRALTLMAQIASVLNKNEESSFFSKEAKKHRVIFNKTFFDSKRRIYKDGATTDHASLHANMFALAFGLVPLQNEKDVLDFIRSRRMACSVYGAQFLMDALYDYGDADYALSLLIATDDRSWYNMIKVGSTISLEAWDNKYKPNQDWNHAWGAVPANIIMRKLMGVEPSTPAFEKVRIKPQIGNLKWAEASVPTIKGNINIRVDNASDYTLSLDIPANMDAEVFLTVKNTKAKIFLNDKDITFIVKDVKIFEKQVDLVSGKHTIQIINPSDK